MSESYDVASPIDEGYLEAFIDAHQVSAIDRSTGTL
jgi:hypothetical protein